MRGAVKTVLIVFAIIVFILIAEFIYSAYSSLSTFVTNSYEELEDFDKISVLASVADIKILPSETEGCKVICREYEKTGHTVSVSGGTLRIEHFDERKWYEFLSIGFHQPSVTVYLPKGEYQELIVKSSTSDIEVFGDITFNYAEILVSTGDVEFSAEVKKGVTITASTGDVKLKNSCAEANYLKTSTGDITVLGGRVFDVEVSVSTGEIEISDLVCEGDVKIRVSTGEAEIKRVSCRDLISDGNTGDILLEDVIASSKFDIIRTTGDVEFMNSDASEIFVETDTGDVSGTLLSPKMFTTKTSSGKVRVPDSVIGGRCDIKTSTGNIIIRVK